MGRKRGSPVPITVPAAYIQVCETTLPCEKRRTQGACGSFLHARSGVNWPSFCSIKTLLSASKSLYLPCALKTEPPDAAFPGHPIGYYHITSLHFLHKVAAPTSPSVYLFTTCSPIRMQAPCGACSPNIPSTKTVSIQ